ncbi:hypothetical protein Tco_0737986 [Tanacetum coccineum]
MPRPSEYFKKPKTSKEEMMRELMARQIEANERMKNQVVELKRKINQGLRNRQAIIENLERQFDYLEKIQRTESLPRGCSRAYSNHAKPILSNSNSKTVSPFLKDCTVHIPYMNAKMFTDDVLPNHVGGEDLNSIDGVGIRVLTKKEVKKDEV